MQKTIKQNKTETIVLVIAGLFFTAVGLIMYVLWLNLSTDTHQHSFGIVFDFACVGLTISIAVAFAILYRKKRRIDLFEFPVWFTLNIYIQVVLNFWLFQRDIQFSSPWLVSKPDVFAVRSVILIWGSLAVLWITYFGLMNFSRKKKQIQSQTQLAPRWKLMGALWTITWLINFYATFSGVQGYLRTAIYFTGANYLLFINVINDMITFIMMLYYFRRPTGLGTIWIVFACLSSLLISLILGTKGAVFTFLYLIICYYYARQSFPKVWMVVGLLSIIIIVPLITTFRSNMFAAGYSRSSGVPFTNRVIILGETARDVVGQPIPDLITQTRDALEQRQGNIFEVTAAFLAVHPEIRPFTYNELIDAIASTIIPRIFWPDKPATRLQLYNISTNYFGATQESSFAAAGQIADSYRTGGGIFTALWFFFLTMLMIKVYAAGPGRESIPGTAFYLVLLTSIVTYENDVYITFMHLLQYGVLLFLLNRYVLFHPLKKQQ